MKPSDNFYDAILSAGASISSMEKTASEKELEAALSETDLTEEELCKLANEIEDALINNVDDIDEVDDEEGEDDIEDDIDEENADNIEENSDNIEENTEDDDEVDEDDLNDTDIQQLAAAYEEEYEKYASEGLGVREYVYNQVENEEFACVVGDMAEKLAYVAELPVFMVADDLMNTIASKISEDSEC